MVQTSQPEIIVITDEQMGHDLVTALLLCFRAEPKPINPPICDQKQKLDFLKTEVSTLVNPHTAWIEKRPTSPQLID